MPNKYGRATEAETQVAIFQWAAYYPELEFMYAIPNGGSRNSMEAKNLKKQGVKAGVPDICLPLPKGKYNGLYIELKVEKNKVSEKQEKWITHLSIMGYKSAVCIGFEDAQRVLVDYLKQK